MPRIYTLNDVGNSNSSKLGSPPSNRYPPSRLELEEQLKKDREKFIRSAKQLITKYHVLDEKNKCMQNDLDYSHEENERMQDDLDYLYEENERMYNSMNQIISLTNQLNSLNNKLVSQITCEQKSHADLNTKQLKEIESLKSMVKSLESIISLMQKASSLKDSDIISLGTKINELEAELKQAMQKVLLKDSDTIQLCSNPSLEIKAKELENELEKVMQNSSFKDRLIFCLKSRVSDLKRQAKRDKLEQIPLKSYPSSNDLKTDSNEKEEVSSFFFEDAQSKTLFFSSHCSEFEPDERKVKNKIKSPIDHTEQKSKKKLDSNHLTISPITTSRSDKALISNEKFGSFFFQFAIFLIILLLIIYFLWSIFSYLYSFIPFLNEEKIFLKYIILFNRKQKYEILI